MILGEYLGPWSWLITQGPLILFLYLVTWYGSGSLHHNLDTDIQLVYAILKVAYHGSELKILEHLARINPEYSEDDIMELAWVYMFFTGLRFAGQVAG